MLTFDDCRVLNHTEAYQLCRSAGIPCLPSNTRDQLVMYLLGLAEPPPQVGEYHAVDAWRRGLGGFVMDHWARLQPQLTCPIKSGDPRACFGCTDTQVVDCVVTNRQNEHLIQLHRKRS